MRKRNQPYTNDEFLKIFNAQENSEEYTVLTKYERYKKPILIRHNKCGAEYFVTPGNFITLHYRCKCRTTTGKKTLLISENYF